MSKASKRVVVDEAYFNLIKRKSDLIDEAFFNSGVDGLTVSTTMIKEYNKIDTQWQRLSWDVDSVEQYVEPKPEKKKKKDEPKWDEPKQDKPKSSKKTKRS